MKIIDDLKAVLMKLTPSVDYGIVWYNTETGELRVSLADGDPEDVYTEWETAFSEFPGVSKLDIDAEIGSPKGEEWVKVGVNMNPNMSESLFESMGPFERMVEQSYSHSAVSSRLDQRRANSVKQQQGRKNSRDFKKAGGQRIGQRQRSLRRSRVVK